MKHALQEPLSHYSGSLNKGIVIMKNYILKLDYLISDKNLKNKFTLDAIEVMDYGQEVFYVLRELWCSDFG